MTTPTVSVCIPAYGRPRELQESMASVLSQTFEDFELIIGDDSGDLEHVARAAGDERVRYSRNETRLGMAANWTHILDLARGRYRALLMDDDVLLPDFLAATVQVLDADSQVGVAFTNHYLQRGAKRTLRSHQIASGRHDDFLKTILLQQPVAVSAALMRREAWAAARPLPDLLAADLVMYIRITEAGWAFHCVDAPLMAYRVHPGQLSAREERSRGDLVRAWELFEFSDPECESIRQRLLSSALFGRAATNVKAGRMQDAEADVAAARALARPGNARELLISMVARYPTLRSPAVWSWNTVRRIRGLERLPG